MARLIDADALLNECAECQKTDPYFEGRGWASHFISNAGEPSTEWYCVENMIENAPTIDAIPMWWITEKFLDVLNKDKELSKAVWLVRKAWTEEQEVRGT